MLSFKTFYRLLAALLFSTSLCVAHEDAMVDHHDLIHVDQSLSLSQLVTQVLEKFPDQLISDGLEQEADALHQRGNSWLAASPDLSMRYQDDFPGDDIGSREMEAELNLPLWNWGQRSAGQELANQASSAAKLQYSLIRLKVAGLVRQVLWDMELESIRYAQAKSILDLSEQLLNKIERRVELGDLARSDLLLAQSDHLQKRSSVIQTEAEMMHSRQRYISLTQSHEIPANYKEELCSLSEITEDHPRLLAINTLIKRKQAEVNWVKSAGSGQPSFTLGGKSERGDENEDDIESMSVGISIPFGGSAHLAPDIAAANLELTEVLAQRAHLFRELKSEFHEAEHALEVSRLKLKTANELKKITETHLKMTQLSFAEGEINLIDLLKIQSRSYQSIRLAKESEALLQKNIAMYNQAVGVQP